MIRWVQLLSLFMVSLSIPCMAITGGTSSEGEPVDRLIVGSWKFYKVFYDGAERPPFSPNLNLYFQFSEEGQSRVYYYRTGQKGFCERKGHYYIEDNILVDKVTWVNRNNEVGCGQDPDMRLGNETRTPIDFKNGDFYLYLSLKGEPLVYIWQPVEGIPPQE